VSRSLCKFNKIFVKFLRFLQTPKYPEFSSQILSLFFDKFAFSEAGKNFSPFFQKAIDKYFSVWYNIIELNIHFKPMKQR